MRTLFAAAAAGALLLAPAAHAASFYSTSAIVSLNIAAGGAVVVDASASDDESAEALGNATAGAEGDVVANAGATDAAALDDVSISLVASGEAFGFPFGAAESFAEGGFYALIDNPTASDITLGFDLVAGWSLAVGVDDIVLDDAFALLSLLVTADGVDIVDERIVADLLGPTASDVLALSFDLLIPAGSAVDLELFARIDGLATSATPVPLPAAAPLLLAALGGLVALRRRTA